MFSFKIINLFRNLFINFKNLPLYIAKDENVS